MFESHVIYVINWIVILDFQSYQFTVVILIWMIQRIGPEILSIRFIRYFNAMLRPQICSLQRINNSYGILLNHVDSSTDSYLMNESISVNQLICVCSVSVIIWWFHTFCNAMWMVWWVSTWQICEVRTQSNQ